MSSNHITPQRMLHSSNGSSAAAQAEYCSPPALADDPATEDREQQITSALCSQLDRVLDELWMYFDDPTAMAASNVALAQLAMRLCGLYPRPTPKMAQRIMLGEHVLELQELDAIYERDALLGRACVRMTRLEAALLRYLIGHRDRVVSREELMQAVWHRRLVGRAARTIDIHVHRLRRKLGNDFAERLETIRSVGYTFSTARRDSNARSCAERQAPSDEHTSI